MPNSAKGNTYKLVNPYVKGEFKKKILKQKIQLKLLKYFTKFTRTLLTTVFPNFYFSIQKGGSGKGKYYHFEVQRKKKKIRSKLQTQTI